MSLDCNLECLTCDEPCSEGRKVGRSLIPRSILDSHGQSHCQLGQLLRQEQINKMRCDYRKEFGISIHGLANKNLHKKCMKGIIPSNPFPRS